MPIAFNRLQAKCRSLSGKAMPALLCLAFLTGCGSGFRTFPPGTIIADSATTVSVYPYTDEDLAGPCVYDLRLPAGSETVAGILVIFERGDSQDFYNDATVQAVAARLHFAMLFAHECDAATTGSFQADATKGPARVLTAALSELAVSSAHPELATANLALFGFSAAGVLSATLTNAMPARIAAVISYAPGDAYVDLDTVPVAAAAQVPTLVMANALDEKSGTGLAESYFDRGRAQGGQWLYAVQNATTHCCTLSTRSLALPWLTAVAGGGGSLSLNGSLERSQRYATFVCAPDGATDGDGGADCAFTQAAVQTDAPKAGTYGLLPDAASAAAWLAWVLNPVTN